MGVVVVFVVVVFVFVVFAIAAENDKCVSWHTGE